MGLFARLRQGLSRTTAQFVQRFDEIVRRADGAGPKADPDTLDALEELLISADIGVVATGRILDRVRLRSRAGGSLRDLVKECGADGYIPKSTPGPELLRRVAELVA